MVVLSTGPNALCGRSRITAHHPVRPVLIAGTTGKWDRTDHGAFRPVECEACLSVSASPARGKPMITIDHGGKYPIAYSLVNGVKRGVFDDVYYYTLGEDAPHYLVPAIPMRLALWPDGIGLVTDYEDATYDLHALWLKS